jgi:hypothetical protein
MIALSRQSKDADQVRRRLALALGYDGGSPGVGACAGFGAGLVLPWCNSATISLHLADISQAVSPGAHAVVLLDQAGWRASRKLSVPAHARIVAQVVGPELD